MTPEIQFSYSLEEYTSRRLIDTSSEFDVFLFTMLFMNGSFFDMRIVPHSAAALQWVCQYLVGMLGGQRVDPGEPAGAERSEEECYTFGGAMSVVVQINPEPLA